MPTQRSVLNFSLNISQGHALEGAIITCAHDSAIDAIASDPIYKRIATAGRGEIKVWNLNPDCKDYVPSPSIIIDTRGRDYVVTRSVFQSH